MRACVSCGVVKSEVDFYAEKSAGEWLRASCKACHRIRAERARQHVTDKVCGSCKTSKSAADFYKSDNRPDGLYSRCKACHRATNDPKAVEYKRQHPLKKKEWDARANARRSKASRERMARYSREYRLRNPQSHVLSEHKRRSLKKSAGAHSLTTAEWHAILAVYKHACAYCGVKPKRIQIDHVIPLSKGGLHRADNVVPSCGPCNRKKWMHDAPTFQSHLGL